MKFSDELLMAYADGELDPDARAEIEAAMARDPEVARAVERNRALASRIRAAYDGVLAEPVPERLSALAAAPLGASVGELAARRGAAPSGRRPTVWLAMAASVVGGLLLGVLLARGPAAPYEETPVGLVARGKLAEALETRLASGPLGDDVRIGLTFRGRDGAYCRTFTIRQEAATAGLACRGRENWRIEVLASAKAVPDGEFRTATSMPAAVLHAVDASIDGAPLDAAAEVAAREAGWRDAQNVAE